MSAENLDDSAQPLIEHLTELRQRLIYAAGAFIVAMVFCYMFWKPAFFFLTEPVCAALASRGQDCALSLIKMQEGFFTAINISFLGGFALAFPIIAYQLWRFVAPGLYRNEKNAFLPFLIASPMMFLAGAAFAYYVILPMAFNFFLSFQQAPVAEGVSPTDAGQELQRVGILFQGSMEEYLGLTIKFIMAFGLCFQLPVLLSLMGEGGGWSPPKVWGQCANMRWSRS